MLKSWVNVKSWVNDKRWENFKSWVNVTSLVHVKSWVTFKSFQYSVIWERPVAMSIAYLESDQSRKWGREATTRERT